MSSRASFGISSAGLSAQRRLAETSHQLGRVYDRLSSGQRITRASDDAAGLSISSTLSAQSRVLTRGLKNLNDGVSMLNITDSALSSLTDIVIRQKELAEQSANGTYSSTQRAALQREATSLNAEYNRIVQTTRFNGIATLNGSSSQIVIQDGVGTSGTIAVQMTSLGGVTSGSGSYSTSLLQFDTGASGGLQSQLAASADFNGDGRDDIILVGWEAAPGLHFRVFYGNSNGTFSPSGASINDLSSDFDPGGLSVSIGIGNTVGDSNPDIHFEVSGTQLGVPTTIYYTFTNAGASAGSSGSPPAGISFSGGSDPLNGDFNGDGFMDYAENLSSNPIGIIDFYAHVQGTTSITGQASVDISSQTTARNTLTALDADLNRLTSARSVIGASMSRLEASAGAIRARIEGYDSAKSRILDADIATEAAQATRLSILQQSAASVLSQASQDSRFLLSLLQG